jgi:DNA-binding response OmpR family regulator
MADAPLILVVEDDYDIRILVARHLEELGYRLALANDAAVGATILRAARPALLIADVRLRGGDGVDLAKLAYAMDIPTLLISGHPLVIEQHEGGTLPFLHKPFRLRELAQKVEEVLGSGGSSPS